MAQLSIADVIVIHKNKSNKEPPGRPYKTFTTPSKEQHRYYPFLRHTNGYQRPTPQQQPEPEIVPTNTFPLLSAEGDTGTTNDAPQPFVGLVIISVVVAIVAVGTVAVIANKSLPTVETNLPITVVLQKSDMPSGAPWIEVGRTNIILHDVAVSTALFPDEMKGGAGFYKCGWRRADSDGDFIFR
jgi:hypothetical protein